MVRNGSDAQAGVDSCRAGSAGFLVVYRHPMTISASHVHHLVVEPLTQAAFAPFGDVIEAGESIRHFAINSGFAERYHDLARIDVAQQGGHPLISIFRAKPRVFPMAVETMERHPLGSQTFIPISQQCFLVVVAAGSAPPQGPQLRCFMTQPGQGVNYRAGVWHHPLIAMHDTSDFLVIDRGTVTFDANCEETTLPVGSVWLQP